MKADLFAAGVILFTLVAGRRPFYNAEDSDVLFKLALHCPDRFWASHEKELPDNNISPEFKHLFGLLISADPINRPSVQDILAHPWM